MKFSEFSWEKGKTVSERSKKAPLVFRFSLPLEAGLVEERHPAQNLWWRMDHHGQ